MNLMHTRTNEVTLIVRWDDMENFGIAHLVKTELEEKKGLHNRKHVASLLIDSIVTTFELSEFMQEFVTEVEGLTLRLVFKLYTILPNEDMVKQSGGYLSKSKESTHYLAHEKVKIFC
jgi:hypothetical protein